MEPEPSAWGIDLGTTNSSIARLQAGRPVAVRFDGSPLVPSVVQYLEDRVIVGREARNTALVHPERTVRSVKRSMGKPDAAFDLLGGRRTPPQVSAEILRSLARGAKAETGEAAREVVITVPAYFNELQRKATLEAAELAGLTVLRLLSEPTSASLVYEHVGPGENGSRPENVLIYDLGGGTFDVSVPEVFEGAREVRATAGDTALGGDDFDQEILQLFLALLQKEEARPEEDRRVMARLTRLAEEVKIRLSTDTEVEVREEVPFHSRSLPLKLTVTRRQFEAAIAPRLERTIELSRRALDEAGLKPQAIDRICLVGGSTRIPMVRRLIEEAFPAPVHEEIDPDLCVALGASIQAGLLKGVRTDRILVDVAAHSLGIRAAHHLGSWIDLDSLAVILPRNSVLPAQRAEEFYTMMDRQEAVQVRVYQGEDPVASRNPEVGSFRFKLKPAPSNSPVRVEFAYDLNGLVQVTASQPDLGNTRRESFTVSDAAHGPARGEAVSPPARPERVPVAGSADGPAPLALGPALNEVIARARRLLSEVEGEPRLKLETSLSRWETASDGRRREDIENEILEIFVELEAGAGGAAPLRSG
jgi:molecular chaperone DnaK